jgi:hypothetical protein
MDFDITFTDIVTGLGEEPGYVNVIFRQHAANYRLVSDRPDFNQQLTTAKASLKRKKPVKVETRGVDIISMSLM